MTLIRILLRILRNDTYCCVTWMCFVVGTYLLRNIGQRNQRSMKE